MVCKQCNNRVADNAYYCPICKKRLRLSLPTYDLPHCDMYGQEIFIFKPDTRKKRLRNNYVWNLNEQKNARNIVQVNSSHNTKTALLCTAIGFATILLCSLVSSFDDAGGLAFFLFLAGLVGFIFTIIIRRPVHDKKFVRQISKISKIHESKLHYYTSANSIGYTILDHVSKNDDGPDTYYYAHYEVDKRTIKSVAYDSYYAEYVLYLTQPVYMDYDLEPQYEFRIADIFDDQIFSKALGCDLPPKHMNF